MTNNCRTAIMALNIIIGHKVSTVHASVGRSFYIPQGAYLYHWSPYCQRNFWLFAFFAFLTIWSVNGLYSTQLEDLEVDQSFFLFSEEK